ncbi:preprotein translocase subunit SecA [Deferribacter autotrophicus]|uniref:Protein translocase subunit SecA n=1 Tax=Deferribacter autotrophicus TaxID=500465 RepID=A0A5A8F5C4_9BACT|nr:preprotein translocase subunit SecA [Deferribacter autotrophicus]KAA0258890.1 preprotein translocase subunit SecA [Deferribacter autotrophicus]
MIKLLTKKIFGSYNDRYLKKIKPIVSEINAKEDEVKSLTNEQLSQKTAEFKAKLEEGKTLDDILVDVFAVVREVSKRTLNMRHFDVQLMGGYVLHKGKIAEMKTGEGKTLVATLALYLNALPGKGAHLVTVNDYLARRDALWMGPIYLFLGLSVGVIQHETSYLVEWDNKEKFTTKLVECDRKTAYLADITYGTNNEFGFDYLRDNMKYDLEEYVQRDLHYAIVDEVDSILIDEARTPLIISGPTDESTDKYYEIDRIVRQLKKDEDYTVDEKSRTVKLTESGINKIESALKIDNLFDIKNMDTLHFVNNALKAHALFKRDVDYVVQDGKVIIVDEFTGRLMPGRRFSEGLHQALEAKEGVEIESENQTLASITFQNYFRMYEKLAGMTGTAATEAQEFREIYGLDVIVIPTHKPMIRKDYPDVIYRTVKEKYDAIVKEIVEMHSIGRPVLVGTTSIEKSEYLSKLLKKKGIPHEVLNAKYHEREAHIVARAGQKYAVTIATNMAGRGTDIKLGPGVAELGGLHILGTERHESRRIDNQLRGRSGRQGDPGSSRFFLSLEDDLLRIFGSDKISAIMNRLGMKEGEPIEHPLISKAIENAQKKVEAMHFEIRKHLLEYDNVMNQQRQVVYALRRTILEGKDLDEIIAEHTENVVDDLIKNFIDTPDHPDVKGLSAALEKIFDIKLDLDETVTKKSIDEEKKEILAKINEKIAEKKKEIGEHFYGFVRFLLINILDNRWKEHLLNMDYLRDSVGLRGYGQKDPLIEYKKESYNLFMDMMNRISYEFMEFLTHIKVEVEEDINLKREQQDIREERRDIFGDSTEEKEKKKPIKRTQPKIGRNDPCPCGSGKKYKKCCGANH